MDKTVEEVLSEVDVALANNVKADRNIHFTIQEIMDQFKRKYKAEEEDE